VTPQWTVTKSTPSAACSSIASKISSSVIEAIPPPARALPTAAW